MNLSSDLYRSYHYPQGHHRAGELSGQGLSATGLDVYLTHQKKKHPELLGNVKALVNSDPHCTPEFTEEFWDRAFSTLQKINRRTLFPIYRRNHTVGLIKEEDQFLLLDSYNAFGAEDADHVPLLRFLRNNFSSASISTLHDKMQNDYHNCAFFAVQNLLKVEREISGQNISLPQFIEQIDTQKVYTPTIGNHKDIKKITSYDEMNIASIATPACLVPHIQSLSQANKTTENSVDFRSPRVYLPYGTHERELNSSTVWGEHKGRRTAMNAYIQSRNDEFRRSYES